MEVLNLSYLVPILLSLFFLNTYMGYQAFKKRSHFRLFISGCFSILISPVFPRTLGQIMFAIGIIKFFTATQNMVKVRSMEK